MGQLRKWPDSDLPATGQFRNSEPAIQTPQPSSRRPEARLSQGPLLTSFSISTKAARRAMQASFITPRTNSSAISAQQHSRQYPPCRSPITKAPSLPSRHSLIKKASGLRHLLRQASLRTTHRLFDSFNFLTIREPLS